MDHLAGQRRLHLIRALTWQSAAARVKSLLCVTATGLHDGLHYVFWAAPVAACLLTAFLVC